MGRASPNAARGPLDALLAVLLLIIPAGCGADAPPPAMAVADVGYSEAELGALSESQRSRLAVLTAFGAATARGELDRVGRPFIESDQQSALLQKLAVEVALDRAGLDDDTLRRRYRQDPETELTVRHIVFLAEPWQPDSVHQAKRRQATAALERARAGEDFASLAAELSEEPGAAQRGGRLQPGGRDAWVDAFWEAASSLDIGEISDVVRSEYGYHVILLEDRSIIPFDEVRDRVLDRLIDVEARTEQADAWVDSVAAELTVDEDAVRAWRTGDAPDSTELARWPAGRYTAADFRDYLYTLDEETRARLEPAPTSSYAGVVRGAARNALLAAKAREMGIELTPAARAAPDSAWSEQAQRWARALGFQPDQEPAAIKDAAIDALGSVPQNAQLARREVLALEPVLRSIYPVRTAPAADDGANGG